ncbi:MAG: hypothetical protein LBE32_06745 [Burkholderiales bacterium]|nr:hypothetical protein [Burkholderiales bacterium]
MPLASEAKLIANEVKSGRTPKTHPGVTAFAQAFNLKTAVGRTRQCCDRRARQGATTTWAATPRGGATQHGAPRVVLAGA